MTALGTWVSTDCPPHLSLVRSNLWKDSRTAEWDLAFEKLEAWLANPAALADDDFEPPTRTTIRLAIALAAQSSSRMPAPLRVMPDGEAGIVFEWSVGTVTSTWEIDANRYCEITRYEGGQRTYQSSLDLSGLRLA